MYGYREERGAWRHKNGTVVATNSSHWTLVAPDDSILESGVGYQALGVTLAKLHDEKPHLKELIPPVLLGRLPDPKR